MYIGVIDGQGGGRPRTGDGASVQIVGASHRSAGDQRNGHLCHDSRRGTEAATGENAIFVTAPRCDVITRPIGIVLANAMLGELTRAWPKASAAALRSKCFCPCRSRVVRIAGYTDQPLSQLVTRAVDQICQYAAESAGL